MWQLNAICVMEWKFLPAWKSRENKGNSRSTYSMPGTVLVTFQKFYIIFTASYWSKYESFYRWGDSNLERARKGWTSFFSDRVPINMIEHRKWESETNSKGTVEERYITIKLKILPTWFHPTLIYVSQHLHKFFEIVLFKMEMNSLT